MSMVVDKTRKLDVAHPALVSDIRVPTLQLPRCLIKKISFQWDLILQGSTVRPSNGQTTVKLIDHDFRGPARYK